MVFDCWFVRFLENISLESQNTHCLCSVLRHHFSHCRYTQTAFTEMTTERTQLMSNVCEIPQSQTNLKGNNQYDPSICEQTNNNVQNLRSTQLGPTWVFVCHCVNLHNIAAFFFRLIYHLVSFLCQTLNVAPSDTIKSQN